MRFFGGGLLPLQPTALMTLWWMMFFFVQTNLLHAFTLCYLEWINTVRSSIIIVRPHTNFKQEHLKQRMNMTYKISWSTFGTQRSWLSIISLTTLRQIKTLLEKQALDIMLFASQGKIPTNVLCSMQQMSGIYLFANINKYGQDLVPIWQKLHRS